MTLMIVELTGGVLGDRVGCDARAAMAIESLDELRKLLGVRRFRYRPITESLGGGRPGGNRIQD